ncbi:uncharacterized protein [Anabrus simplex]|uniref:uncharacterized protein n=1 Tax=Anabrus simplex TaxID=316456 RepID=UPI0034DD102A
MIAFVGICCAVVGTVLGAMKASGREHLTVSLLMIGVGIVLITVSGVAWRLTAHDAPSCRMMLGLSSAEESGAEPNRRFVPRLPPSYGRPHHPYAAMMYPEFQYRPPPPSYQASMQEYRLRLLLLDRHSSSPGQAPAGHTVSPPPTYRSHAGSTLRATLGLRRDPLQSDYSRPPSYRSRTSSTRPTLDPNGNTGCSTAEHSRDPSLSLSESGGGSAVVNVISVMGNGGSEPETLDNIKMIPDQDMPLRMMLNKGGHSGGTVDGAKDGNLVTIVQTDNGTSPVIVTVSGSTMATTTMGGSTSGSGVDPEMEILAHL